MQVIFIAAFYIMIIIPSNYLSESSVHQYIQAPPKIDLF